MAFRRSRSKSPLGRSIGMSRVTVSIAPSTSATGHMRRSPSFSWPTQMMSRSRTFLNCVRRLTDAGRLTRQPGRMCGPRQPRITPMTRSSRPKDERRPCRFPRTTRWLKLPAGPRPLRLHQVREDVIDARQVAFTLGPQPIEDLRVRSYAHRYLARPAIAQPDHVCPLFISQARNVFEVDARVIPYRLMPGNAAQAR